MTVEFAVAASAPPSQRTTAPREAIVRELCVIEIGDGFALRWRGELRLVAVFESQRQAMNAGLQLAWREQVDVLVQRKNGSYDRLRPLQPVEPEKRKKGSRTER